MSFTTRKLMSASGGAGEVLNVEDVFSTFLYAGTGSAQTFNNGIDLSGEGGMVWLRIRNTNDGASASGGGVYDTERGIRKYVVTFGSNAQSTSGAEAGLYAFNSNGFTLGTNWNTENYSGYNYVSWTFRKHPKFFDVVTYTGTGSTQTINHNLDSAPGCILIKMTSSSGSDWTVYHRGSNGGTNPALYPLVLNSNGDASSDSGAFNSTEPSSTTFTVKNSYATNNNGSTYVAYLFAHNDGDGEFGPDGDADIIKCGNYTGNGSSPGPDINIGFEPQWLMIKNTSSGGTSRDWVVVDCRRGFNLPDINTPLITPNNDAIETASGLGGAGDVYVAPTATGFFPVHSRNQVNEANKNYIYIAIRRDPMAVPENGSDVFFLDAYDSSTTPAFPTTALVDFALRRRPDAGSNWYTAARIIDTRTLFTNNSSEEDNQASTHKWDFNTGWGTPNSFSNNTQSWMWKRAPKYFDVVGYAGTGSARTVNHSLGVVPEMIWVKKRTSPTNSDWGVYHIGLNGGTDPEDYYLRLNDTNAELSNATYWNNTAPTASNFTVNTQTRVNNSGDNYIAFLFASLAGVSKVGSYTGTGNTLNVDCGFTSGARFVFIKTADDSGGGSWYMADSLRGIVAGDDPTLKLEDTAVQSDNRDWIDPLSSGFTITSTAGTSFNASGLTYIFYAIA